MFVQQASVQVYMSLNVIVTHMTTDYSQLLSSLTHFRAGLLPNSAHRRRTSVQIL